MAKLSTYKAYGLGCVVVWGVVLIVAGATSGYATFSSFLLVADGSWMVARVDVGNDRQSRLQALTPCAPAGRVGVGQ
jgi:hypothetical protein